MEELIIMVLVVLAKMAEEMEQVITVQLLLQLLTQEVVEVEVV